MDIRRPSRAIRGKTMERTAFGTPMNCAALVAACGLAFSLAGCASGTRAGDKPSELAPSAVSMDEWMARARLAANEGRPEQARTFYRAAAQNYPAEKLPWLKLSEDYFNAQDYGNAVIAAQEALQRDGQDAIAHSILAISGLRLTGGSLMALRQDSALTVGSRDEAIAMARALRDTLGAASLLAPAVTANTGRPTKKPPPAGASAAGQAAMQRPGMAVTTGATGSTTGAGIVPTAAMAAPGAPAIKPAYAVPAGNPLDKLK
jgi:hypothetical protein